MHYHYKCLSAPNTVGQMRCKVPQRVAALCALMRIFSLPLHPWETFPFCPDLCEGNLPTTKFCHSSFVNLFPLLSNLWCSRYEEFLTETYHMFCWWLADLHWAEEQGQQVLCDSDVCVWISFCLRNWGLWTRTLCRLPVTCQPHPAWFPLPPTFPARRRSQVGGRPSVVTRRKKLSLFQTLF